MITRHMLDQVKQQSLDAAVAWARADLAAVADAHSLEAATNAYKRWTMLRYAEERTRRMFEAQTLAAAEPERTQVARPAWESNPPEHHDGGDRVSY